LSEFKAIQPIVMAAADCMSGQNGMPWLRRGSERHRPRLDKRHRPRRVLFVRRIGDNPLGDRFDPIAPVICEPDVRRLQ
jgi:hypothetical protein